MLCWEYYSEIPRWCYKKTAKTTHSNKKIARPNSINKDQLEEQVIIVSAWQNLKNLLLSQI